MLLKCVGIHYFHLCSWSLRKQLFSTSEIVWKSKKIAWVTTTFTFRSTISCVSTDFAKFTQFFSPAPLKKKHLLLFSGRRSCEISSSIVTFGHERWWWVRAQAKLECVCEIVTLCTAFVQACHWGNFNNYLAPWFSLCRYELYTCSYSHACTDWTDGASLSAETSCSRGSQVLHYTQWKQLPVQKETPPKCKKHSVLPTRKTIAKQIPAPW